MNNWRKSYQVKTNPDVLEFVTAPNALQVEDGTSSRLTSKPSFNYQDNILIDTMHDGDVIPNVFWESLQENAQRGNISMNEFDEHYTAERDWGADLVARAFTEQLNEKGIRCDGHYRIPIARVLMDFGRFPGITPPDADHLHRYAINYPFSGMLNYTQKKYLLEHYYDRISDEFEQIIKGKTIKIAIHTYDKYGKEGALRPLMSIITRPIGYQTNSEIPVDFFDPMYPPILCEYSADRKLTYRISLMMEKGGIPIAHNYPYHLPDGGLEVRSQVWFFFQFLKKEFEKAHPETKEHPSFIKVWDMILDTNLRSTESENLRSYLHMYRKAPVGHELEYKNAREAYENVKSFLDKDRQAVVRQYRTMPFRTSSLGIEVRKDFVWDFEDEACRHPIGPKAENAEKVAALLANALMIYLTKDAVQEDDPILRQH